MNILFISALDIKEKGAQSIRMTLEGYAHAGHNVFLLTSKKPHSKDYYYEKEYSSDKNITIIRIWLPFGKLSKHSGKINRFRELYLFSVVAFIRGCGRIKKEKIDLVYGYEVRGIIPGYYLAKFFHKKFISRFQGTLLNPIIANKDKDKRAWRRVWDHRLAFKLPADLYIMTNDGTLGDKVLKYFNVPKEKTRFWMNGVNKAIYNQRYRNYVRKKYKLPADSVILITVHRLAGWKRTDRALKALAEVTKVDRKVYLVVVGEGEKRAELEDMTKNLKISKNIFFTGGIPNKEVGKYLNGSDVYLGTYDLSNAGNPLFEAMLSGLAVISLNNGTTASFLGNGEAGILIDNEGDFSKEIIKLVKDKKALDKWKKSAKNYSHQKFWTWDERINREVAETEKLLNS